MSSPAVAEQPALQVFFADLHSHTSYSDGKLKPADAHMYARDVAKLDVFILTDHLESLNDAEWADTTAVVGPRLRLQLPRAKTPTPDHGD